MTDFATMHALHISLMGSFSNLAALSVPWLRLDTPLDDPVQIFALLMALILLVPLLCRLIKIPEIVGLIIAGIVLGPHAANVLGSGGAVGLLGQVGLIYIMFQAGIEIDMNGFEENRSHSVVFGILSYALPMILGAGLIYVLLHNDLNHDHLWPTILLLASVFASHTLLSQPIIKKLGIMEDPAVTTTLGGTIVTDMLTLLTLAVIAAFVRGEADAMFWVRLFGLMAVYTAGVWLIVPRLSAWFFKQFESGATSEESETKGTERFVYTLTVVFVCGVLADLVGMEAIIGAFFAGLAVNRLIPERSRIGSRIDFVGETIFIPIFMITVGMVVNIQKLGSPTMWEVAGVILLSVFVTKIIAVFGSAKLFKYTNDQAMVIFGLCVAQAAATLAITTVGVEIGLFNANILNSVIMLILVTCMVSPWVTDHWGRKVARDTETVNLDPDKAPQRLLIPLANPATTESLMNIAVLLHDPKSSEPLYPLTVAMEGDDVEEHVAQGENNLKSATKLAVDANRPVSPVTRVDFNVADGIIRALKELRIRTVLIGWNGQVTTEHRIFGTVLDRLLEGSDQNLFVYRHAGPTVEHKRVILAIPPFSTRLPGFFNAISEIWTLCRQLGVQLHVLTPRDGRGAIEKVFAGVRPSVTAEWIDIPTWDHMLSELQTHAEPKKDLIILMASRKNTVAWGPDIDRLPRQLAKRFQDNSFMVVYPRHKRLVGAQTQPFARVPTLRRLIHTGGDPLLIDALDGEAAIDAITQALPSAVQGNQLGALLKDSAHSSSVRITQGTVLLDAHDPAVPRSSIVVANTSEDDILFKDLPEPVQHIWVLITGGDVTESDHETLLTTLAQRLREHEAAELREVHTTDDVIHVVGA